ncbi:hypothetical protein STAS_25061 [Striga asiatica]|uniref:Calcium uniporter protein C-terminal domain-containing protein n=1 Tax=Striga asiatica TaxID=4170 RepID=A0A5A7QSM6_STRAF|nr:hypothetical protein STAS_25061 [Striga asiatica]
MALRRALSKRLFSAANPDSSSPITTLAHPPEKPRIHREPATAAAASGFLRRFLQRRTVSGAFPSFLGLPTGEILRERLQPPPRIRLDGLGPPAPEAGDVLRVGAAEARRLLRLVRAEQVRERLRGIPASTVAYGEFERVCGEVCGGDRAAAAELARTLDECGNVIVLGGVVFLHPDQVAKSIETLISQSISMPNDPRIKELENLETQKAAIDQKARFMVHAELYCGLGLMVLQTLGFMRLTFWELSWDVMEPICFFVTSLHFALAYAFFLRTSKEPSFEGYSQRRFKVKQMKLMKSNKFDVERYNELCEMFYPNHMNRYE